MDIKEIINQRYAMPDASLDRLRQCLSEVSYPKGFRVLENGKIEKDIFFIKNGIVRAYTSEDGKEITFWVGKEGATLVSMKGYVNDEPGYETMELMEDSVLYVLKKKKLKELFTEDLHIANWGRRYVEIGRRPRQHRYCHRGTADFHVVRHCFGTVQRVDRERTRFVATVAVGKHCYLFRHNTGKSEPDQGTNKVT